jgi:HK97 family phage major capsid protein
MEFVMDIQNLNKRKNELLTQQELVLNQAQEAHRKLTDVEEAAYNTATAEITDIDQTIARVSAIQKGKSEIGRPQADVVIPTDEAVDPKKLSPEYRKAFWNALKTRTFTPQNAALAEGGTAGDGSYLVPIETDPTIPALAIIETSARSLSLVVTTEMDIKLPFQSAKTVAAAKAESTNSGTNAFATNVPQFGTTTLTAYMGGDSVAVSWELLQDVKALQTFVTADLNRAVMVYEEQNFIVGGSNGATSPLGYLEGAVNAYSESLSIDAILDLTGALNRAYYAGAKFLMNRRTLIALIKEQIAASQFQKFVDWGPGGTATLLGYPVAFSSAMPIYSASPAVDGAVLFGDFAAGWVIGDRGSSAIFAKVLDQVAALNGQTIILGYRRTDQRCRIAEAVQMLTVTG